jgi:hypothetical protein
MSPLLHREAGKKARENDKQGPVLMRTEHDPTHKVANKIEAETTEEQRKAQPAWYFFYGTVLDPEFLQSVVRLDDTPVMIKAKVSNVKLKYGTYYKALCEGEGSVEGAAWFVPSAEAVKRLRWFKTDAYYDPWGSIELEDGRTVEDGHSCPRLESMTCAM